ncbi:MAG: HAD-IA family hydrolase [Nostocoides sp.]
MSRPAWPTVLFDLDGTLADTIHLIVESYNHTLAMIGQHREPEEIRSWIGRSLVETFEDVDPVRSAELDRAYREWNLANTDRLIRRYAGVPELLAALTGAGVTLGIVTSKRRPTATKAMVAVGIEGMLPILAGLEDTATHKPDPAPLRHAVALLGVAAADCVYVGDAVVDVLAARAAGMSSVAVTWGAGLRPTLLAAEPDHLVDSMEDLTTLLLPRTGT